MPQRLPQTSRSFDGNKRREVVHIRSLVLRIEPVVGRRDRDGLLGDALAESFLNKAGVDMRCVIRSDDKIHVLRNICFALDPCVEHAFVKRVLGKIDDCVADSAN